MREQQAALVVAAMIVLAGCGGLGGVSQPADTDGGPSPAAESAPTPAMFEVTNVTVPESVDRGTAMDVSATITNSGDSAGSQEIRVRLVEMTTTTRVSLAADESERITVTLDNVSVLEGRHSVAVNSENRTSAAAVSVENPTPYGTRPITVYLDDDASERNMSAPTRAGLDYWETHDTEYLAYNVSYELTDNRDDADIVVKYTELERCDTEPPDGTEYLGCAPIVTETISTPATVAIQQGMSDAGARDTVIHELGHAHGLTHSDPPVEQMNNDTNDLVYRDPLKIHLRATDGELPTYVRDEIADGLDYFDGHEDLRYGDEFNWEYVDSPEAAHLVITYDQPDADVCFDSGGGSCTVEGPYVAQTEFRLEGMSTQTVPWHVSARLSGYLLTDQPDGLAPDTSRRDRERWP